MSEASQEVGGLGKYFHELGYKNLGNVIQPYHELAKEDCSFDY